MPRGGLHRGVIVRRAGGATGCGLREARPPADDATTRQIARLPPHAACPAVAAPVSSQHVRTTALPRRCSCTAAAAASTARRTRIGALAATGDDLAATATTAAAAMPEPTAGRTPVRQAAELATTRRLLAATVNEHLCLATDLGDGRIKLWTKAIEDAAQAPSVTATFAANVPRRPAGTPVGLLDAADLDRLAPVTTADGRALTHPAEVFKYLFDPVDMKASVRELIVNELTNSADNQGWPPRRCSAASKR